MLRTKVAQEHEHCARVQTAAIAQHRGKEELPGAAAVFEFVFNRANDQQPRQRRRQRAHGDERGLRQPQAQALSQKQRNSGDDQL